MGAHVAQRSVPQRETLPLEGAVDQQDGNGVAGVRGVRLAALAVPHLLGVAVIRRQDDAAAGRGHGAHDARQAGVEGGDGGHGGVEAAGVPHHVGVREIADHDVVPPRGDVRDEGVGDGRRAHLGLQVVGRHLRRRNEDAILAAVGPFLAAVEEVGDVRVLLRLGQPQVGAAVRGQDLRHRARQVLRPERRREVERRVVLGHRRDRDAGGRRAGEAVEARIGQGARDLAHAVGTEVVQHDRIVVPDGSDRSTVGHDHPGLDELVRHAGGVRRGHELPGAPGLAPPTEDDGAVRALGPLPAPVAVHGVVAPRHRRHARAAPGRGRSLDLRDEVGAPGRGGVAAVGDGVHEHARHPEPGRHVQEGGQVPLVAVHPAVRHEPDEVQGVPVAGAAGHRGGERGIPEEVAVADAAVDARQVLVHHAAGAEVHVPDLGVPHLAGGEAYRLAARDEAAVRAAVEQLLVDRRVREADGVPIRALAESPPVEDDEHDGAARSGHRGLRDGGGRRRADHTTRPATASSVTPCI